MAGSTSYVTADQLRVEVGRVVRASDVADAAPERAWLIQNIWREAGVGIVGGPPKGLKTWVVTEIAVAVASGTPFLGVHEVKFAGPVLAFFAEDSLPEIKVRLRALSAGRNVELGKLEIKLIDMTRLMLNDPFHFRWLEDQVKIHRPRLLILDPLVRIFTGNEDDAGQVARILGLLRKLQRDYDMAVVLVHHARKGSTTTSGATLRGSGDLHAWGDSNLYLSPTRSGSRVAVEHRSARAPDGFTIGLRIGADDAVSGLVVAEDDDDTGQDEELNLEVRVFACLEGAVEALGLGELQARLHVGRTRLSEMLRRMVEQGALVRDGDRYLRTVRPER